MFIHDIIKIRYTNDGYLPNYPYHMIAESEMFKAFMGDDGAGFFTDNYPCLSIDGDFVKAYNQLILSILYHIDLYLLFPDTYAIPDWVYTYLLGSTISVNSDKLDIHDLAVQLGTLDLSEKFTLACSEACYIESKNWLGSATYDITAPILPDYREILEVMLGSIPILNNEVYESEINTFYDLAHTENGDKVYIRPATMFGEPHVLKSLRLKQNSL